MPDDHELRDLDPYDLLDREAARLDAYLSTLPEEAWTRPSRCAGWSVRDLVGHLASTEDYHRACLDGTVAAFLTGFAERGATDLETGNAMGIADLADLSPDEVLDRWRSASVENRRRFRERGDGTVDTTVGEYPARWQAFHVAMELATHADDAGVPVASEERDERLAWRAAASRFSLAEVKPDVEIAHDDDRTEVRLGDVTATLDDETLVEGVAARLGPSASVSPAVVTMLAATP